MNNNVFLIHKQLGKNLIPNFNHNKLLLHVTKMYLYKLSNENRFRLSRFMDLNMLKESSTSQEVRGAYLNTTRFAGPYTSSASSLSTSSPSKIFAISRSCTSTGLSIKISLNIVPQYLHASSPTFSLTSSHTTINSVI